MIPLLVFILVMFSFPSIVIIEWSVGYVLSGWFLVDLPLWKIWVNGKDYPIYEMENRKYLKPPTTRYPVFQLSPPPQALPTRTWRFSRRPCRAAQRCGRGTCPGRCRRRGDLGRWWVSDVAGGYSAVLYDPWRIHGAGIYANIKGVYWWDPCYHI